MIPPLARRRNAPSGLAVATLLALLLVACSSSSSSTTAQHDAAVAHDASHPKKDGGAEGGKKDAGGGGGEKHPDAAPKVILDPHDCVSTSATSSESGIGGYCSPAGAQCVHAGTGGTPVICTADVEGTPAHEWFCTIPCTQTSDCGAGGGACLSAPFGQFCVPQACSQGLGDAASLTVDGGPDAGVDASQDAPSLHDAEVVETGTRHDASEKHDAADYDAEVKHDAEVEHDAAKHRDAAAHLDAKAG